MLRTDILGEGTLLFCSGKHFGAVRWCENGSVCKSRRAACLSGPWLSECEGILVFPSQARNLAFGDS